MTAAEIAFAFLVRGLKNDLCLSQYACLAWLAVHGESDRVKITVGLGREVNNNRCSIIAPLVRRGFVTQRMLRGGRKQGRAKFMHDITPLGLKALGLPVTQTTEGGKSC